MRGAIAKTWKGDEDVTCAAAQTWSVKAVQLVGMRQNHERQNPAIVMHFLFFSHTLLVGGCLGPPRESTPKFGLRSTKKLPTLKMEAVPTGILEKQIKYCTIPNLIQVWTCHA